MYAVAVASLLRAHAKSKSRLYVLRLSSTIRVAGINCLYPVYRSRCGPYRLDWQTDTHTHIRAHCANRFAHTNRFSNSARLHYCEWFGSPCKSIAFSRAVVCVHARECECVRCAQVFGGGDGVVDVVERLHPFLLPLFGRIGSENLRTSKRKHVIYE